MDSSRAPRQVSAAHREGPDREVWDQVREVPPGTVESLVGGHARRDASHTTRLTGAAHHGAHLATLETTDPPVFTRPGTFASAARRLLDVVPEAEHDRVRFLWDLGFRAHHYGPFSDIVEEEVEALKLSGLIEEKVQSLRQRLEP